MKGKMKKNSGFTLAEMIISVAILAVVSIYILQMLVTTKNLRVRAFETDQAVRISKNIIELISSGQSVNDSSNDLLLKMKEQDDLYILNFDEDFKIADENKAMYKLYMKWQTDDGLNNINIKINRLKPYVLDSAKSLEISDINSIKMKSVSFDK